MLTVAIAAAVAMTRADTAPAVECTPNGGIRCEDNNTLCVCVAGKAQCHTCPGGCDQQVSVSRCKDATGFIVAPIGAGCQSGMGACAVDPPGGALVCDDSGQLSLAGQCPAGCVDEGEAGRGLYCTDDLGDLRFPTGFACPRFSSGATSTCGMDGKSVLTCQDGQLAPSGDICERCRQDRAGTIRCFNTAGVLQPLGP